MTGRRILDAAAVFKASRGVALKHVALRKHQLDAYSQTSSLAEAARSQTDRVTLTVKAASALAGRFKETGPGYSTQASKSDGSTRDAPIPREGSAEGTTQGGEKKEGLAQDHFYERSEDNATGESPPDRSLGVKQEKAKRHPLPDEFMPPTGAATGVPKQDEESYSKLPQTEPVKRPLESQKGRNNGGLQPASSCSASIPKTAKKTRPPSADQAKRLQREAEKQIPSQAAEPPPAIPPKSETEEPGLKVNQEQDVYYTPYSSNGQVLSGLPRVKLPKNTEDAQESDEHVSDAHMNQDVFYSTTTNNQEQAIPESQAVPVQEQLSDEAYSEIFHSPKVAKLLRGQAKKGSPSKGLELPGVKDIPVKHMKASESSDQVSSSMRIPAQAWPETYESPPSAELAASSGNGEKDVHDLAADIVKDAETMSATTSEVSSDILDS